MVTTGGLGLTALTGAACLILIERFNIIRTIFGGHSRPKDAEPAEDTDDPWAASTVEGPNADSFKALNTDDVVGLKQSMPTVLLDETLDMSAPEIWRLVMCNRDFQKNFLRCKGCTNKQLGPWMLLRGT